MSKLGRARRTRAERIEDRVSRAASVLSEREAWERERAQFWARIAKDQPEVSS